MKVFITRFLAILLIQPPLHLISYAQSIEKKIYETAFTQIAPEIDGLMNDSCWDLVNWRGDFIQMQPYENKPPSQRTFFKILYDENNLYVFIRAFDHDPGKISRRITRRDNLDGDIVEISIDSYYDQQTAFSFIAMASGAKGDQAVTQNGGSSDASWNPVWYLKTTIDNKGWRAEMKIPFSQLRFGKKSEHIWGIQISRYIFRLQESSSWQYIPKGSPGWVHLFGELRGINNIKPKPQIELLPYTLGRIERFEKEAGNPFLDGKSGNLSAGLDGKVAITNDFTLDFSINPDFGQVEADPSEVNLSAFETFLSERRPLFVEGKNIYQFQPSNNTVISSLGSDNLFYSRRIGRYPQYYPEVSDTEYVDMPESSRILGAMKLSGKSKNGLSIGILESVTANERALIDNAGNRRKESVEPLTNYFVGRIEKDFNKGETVLGGIFTGVNRQINDSALFFLHKAAFTGGLDFRHSWKERTWYVAGNTEFSNVRGEKESLIITQQSSSRYFQRPDASYLSVDSSLTSLTGYGATVKLGRSSKRIVQFETSVTVRSPGLEFNDVGYMRYADLIHHGTWVGYSFREPFSIFRNFYLNTNYWVYWNFEGKLMSTYLNLNFNSKFKNNWEITGTLTRNNKYISTSALRGGPSMMLPGSEEFNVNVASDYSKKLFFFLGTYQGIGDENTLRNRAYWTGLTVRPFNALSIAIEQQFNIQQRQLQYVTTTEMNGDPRYLFSALDQKTLTLTFRLNVTINPSLSLEYYGQPFVTAGKYSRFKSITNPHADNFENRFHLFTEEEISFNERNNLYAIDEESDGTDDYFLWKPDFNFRQFRSNLVIRWEYSPGSTLFLVWSQGRTSNASEGVYSYGKDIKDLFDITPHNIFLVKFSYWFSL